MVSARGFLPLGLLITAGCVTTATYDAKVAELEVLRDRDDRAASEREKGLKKKLGELQEQFAQADARRADLERQLQDLEDRLRGETLVAAEADAAAAGGKEVELAGASLDGLFQS